MSNEVDEEEDDVEDVNSSSEAGKSEGRKVEEELGSVDMRLSVKIPPAAGASLP